MTNPTPVRAMPDGPRFRASHRALRSRPIGFNRYRKGSYLMDQFERRRRFDVQREAEAQGRVADSLEVRMALMERVTSGEITLEDAQTQLKRIKAGAKRGGQIRCMETASHSEGSEIIIAEKCHHIATEAALPPARVLIKRIPSPYIDVYSSCIENTPIEGTDRASAMLKVTRNRICDDQAHRAAQQ